ncbi:LamG domain-containing protein [Aquirufa salirivi]|uniref:LamG domain-containing protein n=1 Tax=Aquirufa salirivi TaxID=3104729 RepID=A0ABW8RU11_9BACT
MKNLSKLYLPLIYLLVLSNCKSEEPQTPPVVLTLPASEISLSKAKINGEVTNEGFSAASERGFVMSETNPKPSVSDTKLSVGYGKGTFAKELDNLKVNTKYYFAAFATNTKGTSYGEILNFTTADYLLATLTMEEPKNITYTTVQLTGTVTDEGGTEVTERGFCLNNAPNPTTTNIKIVNGKGSGAFSTVVTQLKEDSTYYARSYAINGKGTSYGKEYTFKTLTLKKPNIVTTNATNIGALTATLNGNITDNGGSEIKEKGFLIGTDQNPIGKIEVSTNDSVKYNHDLKDLKFNTKYYFKAYATNKVGTSYGETLSFTTADYLLATLTSDEPKNINYTSVQLTSTVTDDGGDEVSERGFCLNTSPNPTISNIKIPNGKGKGAYSTVVTQLKDETTYFFRAYAINSKGVSYGKEYTFKTLEYKKPTVETGIPLNIGTRSVTLSGKMVDNGGTDITEKGFLFGTNPNPSDKLLVSNKEPDLYTVDLKDLKSSTKYYFKAFSTNSKGTSIGLENSFVTLTPSFAKVGTNDFAEITDNTVRAGLEIDNDGGSPITEYGICYSSTNSNPTIYDTKVLFGNTVNPPFGEMRKISGLISSTTYYVKGYAINERGVSYGPVKTFSTLIDLSSSVKNSIVAYYPFNGNSLDKSGNNLHLTETNITYTFDRYGNNNQSACQFNGSTSYLIGPSLPLITRELSIVIWVKNTRTSSGTWGCLITTQNSTKQGFLLQDNENLRYDFSFANLNGIGYTDIWTNSILKANFWEVIICTYDGNKVSIYKNGQLETEMTIGSKAVSSTANLMIGSRYFNEFFKGNLDDIGIWNRVLKPEEINYLSTNSIKF